MDGSRTGDRHTTSRYSHPGIRILARTPRASPCCGNVDSKGCRRGMGEHARGKAGSYMAVDVSVEASILGSENGRGDVRVGGGDQTASTT